jgi:UDP-N-acetylmuramate dehydrogenase
MFLENFSLKKYNTFGVESIASFVCLLAQEDKINEIFQNEIFKKNKKLFLGEGSNILLAGDFDGFVLINLLKGKEIIKEDEENIFLKVMSGENWHDLVMYTVEEGWYGLENLALIPGTVGASPVQNIGAYGVEVKDTIEEIEAYDIETGLKKVFKNEECCFGYRDSSFKKEIKDKYFISSVIFKLKKNGTLNISYKGISEFFEQNKIIPKTPKDVALAVIEIRKEKLPDPKVLGNSGSFFKNVFVNEEFFEDLKKEYPEIPFFKEGDKIKIPTAWLIEKAGLKGFRLGDVGIYEKQALILVNYGGAKGEEVKDFSDFVIKTVFDKFKIKIEPEVNFI